MSLSLSSSASSTRCYSARSSSKSSSRSSSRLSSRSSSAVLYSLLYLDTLSSIDLSRPPAACPLTRLLESSIRPNRSRGIRVAGILVGIRRKLITAIICRR